MINKTVIGISGVAGSGKDTFFSLLSDVVPCKRYSLAGELKEEVQQWCKNHYGIDSVNCSREEKEIIRPFLVAHGTTKRNLSKGRHWIERLHERIVKEKPNAFQVITDIRYDDYDNDEVGWLKNELNGILVHVSQYELRSENLVEPKLGPFVKKFRDPVNSEEARNDPKVKQKSDFQIEWEFLKSGQINELSPYVDNFIKWLTEETNRRRLLATTP
jgi:nucleoside-triphosphatase THEP1